MTRVEQIDKLKKIKVEAENCPADFAFAEGIALALGMALRIIEELEAENVKLRAELEHWREHSCSDSIGNSSQV